MQEIEYFWSKYPEAAKFKKQIFSGIEPLAKLDVCLPINSDLEIEFRLGTMYSSGASNHNNNNSNTDSKKFNPHLSEKHANAIYCMLESNKTDIVGTNKNTTSCGWTESINYFYNVPVAASSSSAIELRTQTVYATDAISTCTILKEKIFNQDLQLDLAKTSAIRLSVSREKQYSAVPNEFLKTNFVKIMQRKSYKFVTSSVDCVLDFTKSWSGKTREEAELKRLKNQTDYVIELELLKSSNKQCTLGYALLSMLLKMQELSL